MDQQSLDYSQDLILLSDRLGKGIEQQWTHELRKQILLLLHRLKNLSRKLTQTEVESELIAVEVTLGYGAGSDFTPDDSLVEDHQLRLLELADRDRNTSTTDDSNELLKEVLLTDQVQDLREIHQQIDREKESSTIEVDSQEPVRDVSIRDNLKDIDDIEDAADSLTLQLILCNCPGRDAARELAHSLVKSRLAACINIIANIGSIYWWQGEIKDTAECQLQIKTTGTLIDEVITFIKQNHPDEIPEILVIPVDTGNEEYFEWVKQETKEKQ